MLPIRLAVLTFFNGNINITWGDLWALFLIWFNFCSCFICKQIIFYIIKHLKPCRFSWLKCNNVQRNWAFATNSNFLIPISMQLEGVNRCYFNFKVFDLKELIVWNFKGLRPQAAKIYGLETLSLWQKFSFFPKKHYMMDISLFRLAVKHSWGKVWSKNKWLWLDKLFQQLLDKKKQKPNRQGKYIQIEKLLLLVENCRTVIVISRNLTFRKCHEQFTIVHFYMHCSSMP